MGSEARKRYSWLPLIAAVFGVAAAMLPIAGTYVKRYGLPFSSAFGIYICFLALLAYALASATPAGHSLLTRVIAGRHHALKVMLLLLIPYFCYALGTGDLRWQAILRLFAIASPVIVLYSAVPVRDPAKFNLQDLLASVWLISAVLFHLLQGIWNLPANLDFMARFWLFTLGALCWIYIRPVPGLGYELAISTKVMLAAVKNFLLFAVIAIPLGMTVGFTAWNPRWRGALDFATAFLEIFLFIALLEELFFRGVLQNLLENSFHSRWRGQALASCIFGLFHILHAPFPNWRYVILATIAGWFYGSAYRESGTLLGSAIVHAVVDTTWRAFFTHT